MMTDREIPAKHTISLRRKLLFAIIATAIFFLSLEAMLFLLGWRPLVDTRDPFIGFSSAVSLMEESVLPDGQRVMATRPSKLVWFNSQVFSVPKPKQTRRVVCLGGSTTFGRPYSDSTSFCGWLREYLKVVAPDWNWEVINAGGVSYASYRVALVMEEMAQYEPDLFIVYTGQNEFLEDRTYRDILDRPHVISQLQGAVSHTRTFAWLDHLVGSRGVASNEREEPGELLSGEVEERLNHTIGPSDYHRDPDWEQRVVTHFQFNLERIRAIAANANAELCFVVPSSNLRSCSPFKSEFSADSSDAQQEEVLDSLRGLQQELARDRTSAALAHAEKALSIDPAYAASHYWYGRALFADGRPTQALNELQIAVEEDVCPLRAPSEIVDGIRQFCAESNTTMVDFDQLQRQQCFEQYGHRCLGSEQFLDHVHPTIEQNRQLALWILEALEASLFLPAGDSSASARQDAFTAVENQVLGNLDVWQQGVAMRNLAKVLHWSGKFDEAIPRARDGMQLLEDDAECRLIIADSLKNTGYPERALQEYEALFQRSPDYARGFLPYGELLSEFKRDDEALGYLLSALLVEPENAYAHYTLGKLHLRNQEWALAKEAFEESDRLEPGDAEIAELIRKCEQNLKAGGPDVPD